MNWGSRSFRCTIVGRMQPPLLAEAAAINGCDRVLLGSSRQGAIYHLIKGHFQSRLEELLPSDIAVEVIRDDRIKQHQPIAG